jgi:hypothetical protein
MRPQKRLPLFQWDRGILKKTSTTLFLHRKVVFSTKLRLKSLASAVSMRPRKQIRRSQRNRGSRFSGLNETAEADSAVSMRPRNPLWHGGSPCENEYWLSIPLKGYYSKNKYIRKHYILIVARKRKG